MRSPFSTQLLLAVAGLLALVAVLVFVTEVSTRPAPELDARVPAEIAHETVAEELAVAEAAPEPAPQVPPGSSAPDDHRVPVSQRTMGIEGRVLRYDGEPANGALVGLFLPARLEDGDESPFGPQPDRPSQSYDRTRLVKRWAKCDEFGLFLFGDAEPGTWIVRAEESPLLAIASAPFVLALGDSRVDLVLHLPPSAWIEGAVIVPEGRTLENLCLELRARGEPTSRRWHPRFGQELASMRCIPGADSRYRIGPVETGLHTVGLVIDPTLEQRGNVLPFAGSVVPILDLYLGPGLTERDVDLRGGYPSVVAVKIDVDLFDPSRAGNLQQHELGQVILLLSPSAGAPSRDHRAYNARAGEFHECGPLVPGTWNVGARFTGLGPWTWPLASNLRLDAAARIEVDRRIRIARTRVRFFDAATSEPFENLPVEIGLESNAGATSYYHRTGKDGWLDLALPPDVYMVTAREEGLEEVVHDPQAWTRLTWGPDGPIDAVVRVPH